MKQVFFILFSLLLLAACAASDSEAQSVQGYFKGQITVNAAVDSTGNYSGFEVVVAQINANALDTLGYAITDRDGLFAMNVTAPTRGLYNLFIIRNGTALVNGELMIAAQDSAEVKIELPLRRPLMIRSPENAAWLSYRNARATYDQNVTNLLTNPTETEVSMPILVERTAHILRTIEDNYPNTLGAEVAIIESITLLDGWNDSLMVAWAEDVPASNTGYVEAARYARFGRERSGGLGAGIAALRDFQNRTANQEDRTTLQAEIVRAFVDSVQVDSARAALEVMRTHDLSDGWTTWMEQTTYDLENLMPGTTAPDFTMPDDTGADMSLSGLRGKPVILEFYIPQNALFLRQLDQFQNLYRQFESDLSVVMISVEPDSATNAAFRTGRNLMGTHVTETAGTQGGVSTQYNIRALPTRFLISADGEIVGRYIGDRLAILEEDLRNLLNQ